MWVSFWEEVRQLTKLVSDLNKILKEGGFTLRKWSSNIPSILENVPEEFKANSQTVKFPESSPQKNLGLIWKASQDVMQININNFKIVQTKRHLLSTIARIFDPLGFISPTTIVLKIMKQDPWKDKISWDKPIPISIKTHGINFILKFNY